MLNNKSVTSGNTAWFIVRVPALLLMAAIAAAGCASPQKAGPGPDLALYQRAVASPMRSDDDRASDASRKPLEFLAFAQAAPGMQVLDVAGGGGTTTRLLALVVGSGGRVYSQGQAVRPAFEKRLVEQPQPNIVPVVRPFDDPLPAGTPALDLITINLSYHDIANLPLDRISMDRRLFAALKPGGRLVVIDHAATVGSGVADTKTLHRIDETLVQSDMERAGFRLEQSGDFLRNPADTHERKSSDMERASDKFVLRFVKPAS